MYFIPKYQRYSVGTERIAASSAQKPGARCADTDLDRGFPSSFMRRGHERLPRRRRRHCADERLAGAWGPRRPPDKLRRYAPGLERLAQLLGSDDLAIGLSAVGAFRHLHGKYVQIRGQAHANMDYSRNHEPRQQKIGQNENYFFIFPCNCRGFPHFGKINKDTCPRNADLQKAGATFAAPARNGNLLTASRRRSFPRSRWIPGW